MSLTLEVNLAYQQYLPHREQEKNSSKFVGSLRENSMTDLNMDIFRPSALITKALEAETSITSDTPQWFDHTPLLSRQGRAGDTRMQYSCNPSGS